MSAFEIIDKDEFQKSSGSGETLDGANEPPGESPEVSPGQLHLEWCEFCKDWFIMEYHYGENEDESSR